MAIFKAARKIHLKTGPDIENLFPIHYNCYPKQCISGSHRIGFPNTVLNTYNKDAICKSKSTKKEFNHQGANYK